MIKNENMAMAYTEILEVIRCMSIEDQSKIPSDLLQSFKKKRDRNYEYTLDDYESFADAKLLYETKCMLAVIYQEYLASDERKNEIKKKNKIMLDKKETQKRIEYEKREIFSNTNSKKVDVKKEVEVYEDNIFRKLWKKIISIFKF